MSGQDAAHPLTIDERDMVRKSWDVVKRDIRGSGYDLFERFFTENPTYQANFKSFKDVPLKELRGNKKLAAHAATVLYAITALVDNLDDPEVITEMLLKTSGAHFKRNITLPMFQNLGTSLVGFLVEKVGPELMTPEAIEAWKKTYGVILAIVGKGLQEAEAAQ
jgi:hemoglobin-like flavoprotein